MRSSASRASGSLEHKATHDKLTGLPNRVLFMDRLTHALAWSRRHDTTFAILFIDLDKFKLINDSLGHETGDEVLIEVGRRLDDALRSHRHRSALRRGRVHRPVRGHQGRAASHHDRRAHRREPRGAAESRARQRLRHRKRGHRRRVRFDDRSGDPDSRGRLGHVPGEEARRPLRALRQRPQGPRGRAPRDRARPP